MSAMSATAKRADSIAVPPPTRDMAQGLENIAEYGLTIVPGVLGGEQLRRTRDALYRAAESDRARAREQKFGLDYAHDETNQRVWNVLSRDPAFDVRINTTFRKSALRPVLSVSVA